MTKSSAGDPPAACTRLEREWLDDPDQPVARAHVADCADCAAAAARYRSVGALLEGAGAARPMPDGWEARLISRLDADRRRRRRPRWIAPAAVAGVVAMAAAAVLILRRPEPAPKAPPAAVALAVRVEARGGMAAPVRGVGDRLVIAASAGRWRHVELRLYRGDRELVGRCSDEPPCQRAGEQIAAAFELPAVGRYRVLLLAGDAPVAPPTGAGLDADAAAAPVGAGEQRISEPIDVN